MRRRVAVVAVCVLLALAGCGIGAVDDDPAAGDDPTIDADGELEVHAIDVGQADATLIVGEETLLVDSGDWRDDGETVLAYLDVLGIERIDHLVATHAHADHIGGHEAIIDSYENEKDGVGAVYDSGIPHTTNTYERYLDAIERHDLDLFEIHEGDELPFEGARIDVLNPTDDSERGGDLHYNSVTLRVTHGEAAFLFTGDVERAAEHRLLEDYGDDLAAEVYHAGHHGSDTSSGPEFLDAVDPEIAIVSAAYDSQYGHPHEEPLQRFADRDVRVAWTAIHGHSTFVSDGERISVRTQVNTTFDPLAIVDAEASGAAVGDGVEKRFSIETSANSTADSGAAESGDGAPSTGVIA